MSDSSTPSVFHADTLPSRVFKPAVTFRFNAGIILLTKSLFELLKADNRRVAFVFYKGNWYITRVEGQRGFWLNTTTRPVSGVCSAYVANKPFARHAMRSIGNGPNDIVYMPVAPHPVQASEIALDPAEYPFPFYRIISDQKILKS